MIGGVTHHMLPHLSGVPHLHVNRPQAGVKYILGKTVVKLGKKWVTPNHDLQGIEVDLHFLFNDKLLGRKHTGLRLLRLKRKS